MTCYCKDCVAQHAEPAPPDLLFLHSKEHRIACEGRKVAAMKSRDLRLAHLAGVRAKRGAETTELIKRELDKIHRKRMAA